MKPNFKTITHYRLFLPILCLILVLLVNVIKTPTFFQLSVRNGVLYGYIIDVVNRASELVVLAVGMTLVVAASGGTDISVGSVMAVAAAMSCFVLSGGQVSVNSYAAPWGLGLIAALIVATLCGAWNGFLVAKMRIQPMVATLILFTAGRGIAQLITRGQITYIRVDSYKYLGNFIPHIPLPTSIFVAILVVILTNLLLKKTALGVYIQAVGINKDASRLVGIKSNEIIFFVYTFCGFLAGIAGMIASSRIYSADANNIGLNMELDAILAVALGGNDLAGGKFNITGSVIGAYTIQALTTTLYAMGVTADQVPVYKAIVVVIIVTLQAEEFKKWFAKVSTRRRTLRTKAVEA
jgi:ribose/xylose/arabinose/galactoside ABC-type transport system permease subunit